MIKYYICFLGIFFIQGCKPNSTTDVINSVKEDTSQSIKEFQNYDYAEFFNRLKTAYKTSSRKRYPTTQKIVINTSRDGQLYAYNGIINECEILPCKIKESILNRNTIFPENTTAKLRIEIPMLSSKDFIEAENVRDVEVITNEIKTDDYISKDLEYYQSELTSLNLIKQELETILQKKDIFNSKELERFENNLLKINRKILYTQNDIKYLDEIKDKQAIEIIINREYKSTSNKVKANIQNAIYFASGYLHLIIIALFFISLLWLLKFTKFGINNLYKYIKDKKFQKKVVSQQKDEPHLPTK